MKNCFFIVVIFFATMVAAQNKKISVENSQFSLQTGFAGIWLNNELKLSRSISLHSELGVEPQWVVGSGTLWHPNLRVEPRYYYNLFERFNKGADISNNSGNFFALALNYRPNFVVFSNNNIETIESFSVVPKWGIRRNLGKNFNYEAGIGLGFRHEFMYGNYGEIDFHLRIGYSF